MGRLGAARVRRSRACRRRSFAPNAFLRIGADNSVTVIAKHVEMGQGAYTGIATIVAEELDADWAQVRVESAPADAKRYANLAFGTLQGTGGSSAMANSWMQLREAGAKARAMLLAAAAKQWKVPVADLTVEKGVVHHAREQAPGDVRLARGAAAAPAGSRKRDAQGSEGFQTHRPRNPARGCARQGRRQRAIHSGRRAARHAGGAAQAAAAVRRDGQDPSMPPPPRPCRAWSKWSRCRRGVAVVAKGFWAAKQGRDALKVEWDDSKAEKRSSAAIMDEYRRLADQPAPSARKEGDAVRRRSQTRPTRCRPASSFPTSLTRPWSRWTPSSS